jgi:hypothetical protein
LFRDAPELRIKKQSEEQRDYQFLLGDTS